MSSDDRFFDLLMKSAGTSRSSQLDAAAPRAAAKQVWEECSKDDKPTRGDDRDKHGCKVSTGEYWDGSKCANVRGD